MALMVGWQKKILKTLHTRGFFIAVMALFALESIWIAISAAYPMVFDENLHFGLVQLYAERWNPVFSQQPPGGDFAGALPHNPSLLFHYLLSFPYRLITALTDNQMIQIIVLRFINIAFLGGSLVLFRRLFIKTGASAAIINTTLLFFILIPVVPLLAGQINYDNLLVLLAAWAMLLAVAIKEALGRRKLPVIQIMTMLAVCMFGSLVQFAFLPILAALSLWLIWTLWRSRNKLNLKKSVKTGWLTLGWRRRLFAGLPFIVITGLFIQVYGVNVVTYHTPLPKCDQIISRERCVSYAPWQRDQVAFANKQPVNPNPVLFAVTWIYRMFIAMFYTSSGGAAPQAWYLSINPLPVPFLTALALFSVGMVLIFIYRQVLFKNYRYLGLFGFVALVYCGLLFARNYYDFLVVGQKIAMNGRYLFLIALPVMLIFALAFRQLLARRTSLKLALLVAGVLLFSQGGGALSYLVVSNSHWYWQNRFVISLNQGLQKVAKPLVLIDKPMPPISFTSRQ